MHCIFDSFLGLVTLYGFFIYLDEPGRVSPVHYLLLCDFYNSLSETSNTSSASHIFQFLLLFCLWLYIYKLLYTKSFYRIVFFIVMDKFSIFVSCLITGMGISSLLWCNLYFSWSLIVYGFQIDILLALFFFCMVKSIYILPVWSCVCISGGRFGGFR